MNLGIGALRLYQLSKLELCEMYDRRSNPSAIRFACVAILLYLSIGVALDTTQASNRAQTAPISIGYPDGLYAAWVAAPALRHARILDWTKHNFPGAISERFSSTQLSYSRRRIRIDRRIASHLNCYYELNDRSPPIHLFHCS